MLSMLLQDWTLYKAPDYMPAVNSHLRNGHALDNNLWVSMKPPPRSLCAVPVHEYRTHGDRPEKLAPQHEVERALWMASNRPVRSAEWAFEPDLAAETSREDCMTSLESADVSDTIFSQPHATTDGPSPRIDDTHHQAHMSLASLPTECSPLLQKYFPFTMDVLPDVPTGTESVEVLACHIPLLHMHQQPCNRHHITKRPS